jgi:hypothetical protein
MTQQSFPLVTVLSITTGKMLSRDLIARANLCNFVTGGNDAHHAYLCMQELKRQDAWFATVEFPSSITGDEAALATWLDEQTYIFGSDTVVVTGP